jgi:hypothetical protein
LSKGGWGQQAAWQRFITKSPQYQIRVQNRFNQNVICYFVYLNSYICTNKHKNK